MAENNAELLAQLESVDIPAAMVTSAQLVELLKHHARADLGSLTQAEALRIQTEISAAHIGSHLEVLTNMGSLDKQLRQIGDALKSLRGQQ